MSAPSSSVAGAADALFPSLSELRCPVVLGSSSKWRAQVVREMGIPLSHTLNPDIDEKTIKIKGKEHMEREASDPAELCAAIAEAKAAFLLTVEPLLSQVGKATATPTLLVTSDQVAYRNGQVREKPRDAEQCRQWMAEYSSHDASNLGAQVVTAIVVTNVATQQRYAGVAHASQRFLPSLLSAPEVLEGVIGRGDILQCCGGFMVDDPALLPYLDVPAGRRGTEDEIIGLPKKLLAELLLQAQNDAQKKAVA
jgi:septum formation protein